MTTPVLAPLAIAAAAFVAGGAAGAAATRPAARRATPWAKLIRWHLALTAILLSLLSAWRIDSIASLTAPLALQAAPLAALAAALAWRGQRSRGEATLEAWSASPNGGFWVVPLAAALAGADGVALAVLADRLGAPRVALSTHLLRRDAPIAQTRRTALVDHAPTLALAVGLLLSRLTVAPDWAATVLQAAGPVLAATGAFLYVASVRPDAAERRAQGGAGAAPTRQQRRRWAGLVAVRACGIVAAAAILADPLVWMVGMLIAFSAPAFNPPQLARLYGYDVTIARAGDAGWALAPVGLALALLAASAAGAT